MPDIHLDIDPALGRRRGVEEALRAAIRARTLLPGTRLPSSRTLAQELGVARSTVVAAYEQLAAEGYLDARHGSGTRVGARIFSEGSARGSPTVAPAVIADFRPGEPDLTSFPRAEWAAAARSVLSESPASTFAYGDAGGLADLRASLAAYLGRSRAVSASPERVFIFSGFSDALATLARTLCRTDGRPFAVEDPSLPWHRRSIEHAGGSVHDVPLDGDGVIVEALAPIGACAVLTTPAHQYPLGGTMSAVRRTELVAWARDVNGWIIEDDYDGEFRYDRQPVGSLQGLAPDRVIYAGTASKAIAPGVGIGWLVVPPELVEPLREVVFQRVTTSTIEQAILARFIASGRLDRHVRRMRLQYRRRREELLAVIDRAPMLSVQGIAAGLHLTAQISSLSAERELGSQAKAASVALFPLSLHYRSAAAVPGFVIGFTRPPAHGWAGALRALRRVLDVA